MSRAEKERRRRHRLEKRNRSRRQLFDLSQTAEPFQSLQLLSYDITYDRLDLSEEAPLDLSDDERQSLFEQSQNDPRLAVDRIKLLLDRHPHSPILLNWLHAAYVGMNDQANMEIVAKLNYEMNPRYLFARLNYAAMFLERGELSKVEEIFEGKYDLKLLYPHRNVFHFTEVIGFCAIMVQYRMRKGEPQAAEPYYSIMQQIAPNHPTTQQIETIMRGSVLLQLAKRMSRSLLSNGKLP
jgi:hypothetical protein